MRIDPPESLKSRGAMNRTASTIAAPLDMIGVPGARELVQFCWSIGFIGSARQR
jgi:hypothetical protein